MQDRLAFGIHFLLHDPSVKNRLGFLRKCGLDIFQILIA